jgi:hypothetical protein
MIHPGRQRSHVRRPDHSKRMVQLGGKSVPGVAFVSQVVVNLIVAEKIF